MTIKKLVENYNMPIRLISCPIIREEDGLAMSSRNLLLTNEERSFAPRIYQTLIQAKQLLTEKPLEEIMEWGKRRTVS
jgi:pantoate--beta-alanine ligase